MRPLEMRKKAIAVLAEQRHRNALVGRCYRDEDLGPLLRGEGFEAFRERFPEPKQNREQGRPVED